MKTINSHRLIHIATASLAICLTSLVLSSKAHAGNTWDGEGGNDLWSTPSNWDADTLPGYGTLTFSGSTQTSNTVDTNTDMNQLLWTGTSAWTLNNSGGAVISLYDLDGTTAAKIENQSTGIVTINAPTTFAATAGPAWGEINAVNGDMTFGGGALTVNGSQVAGIKMFSAGKTINFNNTVSATGKWFATTGASGMTVNIGGAATTGDFYLMNGSVLKLNSGGNLNTTALRLGGDFGTTLTQNLSMGATFQLTNLTGGQSFTNTINSVSGNTSSALLVDSQNTSGTNTLSGGIFLDSSLGITQAAGGTLAITTGGIDLKGQTLTLTAGAAATINTSAAIANSTGNGNVVKAGTGTLTLTADSTYTGTTTVNGGTLVLDKTAGAQIYKTGAFFGVQNQNYLVVNTGGTLSTYNWDYGASGALAELRNNYGQILLNGGTIRMNESFSAVRGFSVGTSGATIDVTTGNTYTKLAGSAVNQNIIRFSADSTLTVTGAGNTVIEDSLAPASYGNTGFGIAKTSTGTLTLSGFSRYTGNTTVSGGTVKLTGGIYQGNYQSGAVLTVSGGATAELNNWHYDQSGSSASLGGLRANANAVVINNGTIRMVGTTATSDVRGFTVQSGGAIFDASAGANWTLGYSAGTEASFTGNPSLTFTGAGTGRFEKLFSGSGALTKSGTGTWTLTRANTYTGNTTVNGGTLVVAAGSRIYTSGYNGSAVLTVGSSSTLDLQSWGYGETSQSLGGLRASTNAIVVNGGTIRISGTSPTTYGRGVTVQANGATLEAATGANWTIDTVNDSSAWTFTGNPSLTFTGAGTGTFQKVFSGSGALTKSGTGTWTLSGANTFTGNTTISGGTLNLGGNGGIYTGATKTGDGSITITGGGVLAGNRWSWGAAESLGMLNYNNGYIAVNNGTLRNTAAVSTYMGGAGNSRGIAVGVDGLTIENASAGTTWTWSGGGGNNTYANNAPLTLAGTGHGNFGQTIAGSGVSLTKSGGGTWTVTGTNSYTGTTTVTAGTLLINGNQSTATGTVDVHATATLGGTGTIGGAITLAGTIAPGTSVGILNTGNVAFGEGSTYAWEISDWTGTSGTGWDRLSAGTLTFNNTLAGKLTIRITGTPDHFSESAKTFAIAQGTGTSSFDSANITIDANSFSGTGTWTVQQSPGNPNIIELVYTPATGYADWAGTNAPTGSASDDFDHDGVSNGVEYVLGGDKNTNDLGKLPVPGTDGTNMTFSFVRDQASIGLDTQVAIEVGTTLTGWPDVYAVGTDSAGSAPEVTVSGDSPEVGKDTITLTLPMSPDVAKFARLVVTIAPSP